MARLPENDRSEAAKEIFREASRAGLSKESIGQWRNLANRYSRLGNPAEEAKCLRRALEIHNTFGARHEAYAMATGFSGCTYDVTVARLAELDAQSFTVA